VSSRQRPLRQVQQRPGHPRTTLPSFVLRHVRPDAFDRLMSMRLGPRRRPGRPPSLPKCHTRGQKKLERQARSGRPSAHPQSRPRSNPTLAAANPGRKSTCANSRHTRKAKRRSSILRRLWAGRLERCARKLWRSVSSWVISANDTWRAPWSFGASASLQLDVSASCKLVSTVRRRQRSTRASSATGAARGCRKTAPNRFCGT